MRPTHALLLSSLALLFTSPAHAWRGAVSFSAQERARHAAAAPAVVEATSSCMERLVREHQEFFRRHHVSKFVGDRSAFAKLSRAEKLRHIEQTLASLGRSPRGAGEILAQMEPTSCVGFALRCLREGFHAAGQQEAWQKVAAFTRANGQGGLALQHALRGLGWRTLYWNPDTRSSSRADENERQRWPGDPGHIWGHHEQRLRSVLSRGNYLENTVDDSRTLVDFGQAVPSFLRRLPLFIGTAHGGYHVFTGVKGVVAEGHSTRAITDFRTIETGWFNPLDPAGAPRGTFSGLISIPPGY